MESGIKLGPQASPQPSDPASASGQNGTDTSKQAPASIFGKMQMPNLKESAITASNTLKAAAAPMIEAVSPVRRAQEDTENQPPNVIQENAEVGSKREAAKQVVASGIKAGVKHGTQAYIQGVVAAEGLKAGVTDVVAPVVIDAATLAGTKIKEKYTEHVSEETRTKIYDNAVWAGEKGKEGAIAGGQFAKEQAIGAYQTYGETKQFVRLAAMDGFEALPEETKNKIYEQQRAAEQTREELKAKLLDVTRNARQSAVKRLAEYWKKDIFADPDMPRRVRRHGEKVYDEAFIDIEHEIDRVCEEN